VRAVIAESQTAGRGQWGRHWRSHPGGLYLSVTLEPNLPVAEAAQLTLCTAWGIAIALRTIPNRLSGVEQGIPVQLKWLNDLVLRGYKLGGILTETRVQQGRITQAVVGVGINWSNPVPETGITLETFLADQPTPLIESLEMLSALAVHGILTGYEQLRRAGIDSILTSYFELLAHRDRPIPWQEQFGTLVGIAPTGELRIRLDQGENAAAKGIQPNLPTEVLLKPGTISWAYPL
jgi:BirA family biotin operon repressor/biotin-[acetyl-CoA-carboxylase] ligase